jgi:CubicO group peptidase (beta-lactamase class C family)
LDAIEGKIVKRLLMTFATIISVSLVCSGMTGCTSIGRRVKKDEAMLVHGYTAPGFEQVRSEFVKNFTKRGEIGAACSIYYRGEKVVDLWGGYKDVAGSEPWQEDTLVRVYSTTKGMSLIVLAKLHSDGLLEYGEKVSTYWPEFAANGKADITVEQLVTHKSGLVLLDRSVYVSELSDYAALAPLLKNSTPLWEPGSLSGYCAATIGLFEQQLVQRLDPKGRTMGAYFRDEIAEPLNAEFYIGLPDGVKANQLAELKMISPMAGIFNLHKPPRRMVGKIINPGSLFNKAFTVIVNDFDEPIDELGFEEPSGGGVGTARALARIYGALATGGSELGLVPETVALITETSPPATESNRDQVMGVESIGSRGGYLKPYPSFDFGGDGSIGFSGTGGSFGFADIELGIGFAYVMNKMDFYGTNDPREVALRKAMYLCIENLDQ